MAQATLAELAARCSGIELLALDVDGVLTDGVIELDDDGVESKHFHVRDGLGLALWHRAGKRSAILSGRAAEVVRRRAEELKIGHVAQGLADKGEAFRAMLGELGLDARQVCYVGDDLIDLPVLRAAGLAACPADAVAEVRQSAQVITEAPGGRGAVREVVETILRAQGLWHNLCEPFRVPAM
ncbi:3-deoxy-D-manno-octulosonate 8-phosphate phosphatase KdsC [Aquisphaera giovannonii]|uniref:3-deoxy-D-manno-octulosonate 8-phosphate phosphatase KdsC n=1 Tax=Aquisphaera giovannonii TaxID=406548 RepID=A0A5B9VW08_9BACT|nr:HAD family hydrolase [Aquisphaera giovannonii]QEH32041.1 3-deoxy-D-manno-octulosonate 8-phosphate phosphatase KdsC [Aquisphaera giovannonii]